MEIDISEKYVAHIRKLVDSGRYPSADAVIARALGLLEERDLADSDPAIAAELADIRAKVMQGVEDLKNGAPPDTIPKSNWWKTSGNEDWSVNGDARSG